MKKPSANNTTRKINLWNSKCMHFLIALNVKTFWQMQTSYSAEFQLLLCHYVTTFDSENHNSNSRASVMNDVCGRLNPFLQTIPLFQCFFRLHKVHHVTTYSLLYWAEIHHFRFPPRRENKKVSFTSAAQIHHKQEQSAKS